MKEEIERLHREVQAARTRELLAIAQSPTAIREICVKNEETLWKEMDLLQQEILQREDEIKELNNLLQSVQYLQNEDRCKLHGLLQQKEGTIIILTKQKEVLQTRLNTVKQTIELLRQESAATLGVISEPSQQLKQMIEKDVQLEHEYKRIQQDLCKHERLCSDIENTTMVNEENMVHLLEENNAHARSDEDALENEILSADVSTANEILLDDVSTANEILLDDVSTANEILLDDVSTGIKIPPRDVSTENEILPGDVSTIYNRLNPDEENMPENAATFRDALDPLKIAELYKNLYANHWPVAFQAASSYFFGMPEHEIVNTILEIFERVRIFCKDTFDKQKLAIMEQMKNDSSDLVNLDEARVLEFMGQGTTEFSLSLLHQKYRAMVFGSFLDGKSIFIQESIRICWLMNLSDPPVVEHKKIKSGDKFDPNLYQVYTHQGNKVQFVVLPALMRKDGPIIAKGVVQCKPFTKASSRMHRKGTNTLARRFSSSWIGAEQSLQDNSHGSDSASSLSECSHPAQPNGANGSDLGRKKYPKELTPSESDLKKYRVYKTMFSDLIVKSKLGEKLYDKCLKYEEWKNKQN
ncbi:hypothetical protein DPMN_089838 [Dreissena polymorpha]|uniref:Mitochondria-eating protein C-terminal domain-containing protein n=2 Tax=Dreissena polymorpha TaxID=45954 RepID=A0A9D4QYG6_DREPO|nr:hypothetical protein DPMN_089838 [Dreissena polymorpha]